MVAKLHLLALSECDFFFSKTVGTKADEQTFLKGHHTCGTEVWMQPSFGWCLTVKIGLDFLMCHEELILHAMVRLINRVTYLEPLCL